MYCEKCGCKIDDDSKFCSNCGTVIDYTQGDGISRKTDLSEKTTNKINAILSQIKGNKSLLYSCVLLCIVITIALICLVLTLGRGKSKSDTVIYVGENNESNSNVVEPTVTLEPLVTSVPIVESTIYDELISKVAEIQSQGIYSFQYEGRFGDSGDFYCVMDLDKDGYEDIVFCNKDDNGEGYRFRSAYSFCGTDVLRTIYSNADSSEHYELVWVEDYNALGILSSDDNDTTLTLNICLDDKHVIERIYKRQAYEFSREIWINGKTTDEKEERELSDSEYNDYYSRYKSLPLYQPDNIISCR